MATVNELSVFNLLGPGSWGPLWPTGDPGFQTIPGPFGDLVVEALAFRDGALSLDNIVFEHVGAGSPGGPAVPGPGAVPEPASWALMILGFGAAGATLRVSRRRLQTAPC